MFYSVSLGKGNSRGKTMKIADAFNESSWVKDYIHATDNLFLVKARDGITCKDIKDIVDVVTTHDMDVFVSPVGSGYSALFSPPGPIAEWIQRNQQTSPSVQRKASLAIPPLPYYPKRR
jgi:hypothetical protein